ncbi:MAG: hypothetical protein ACR2HJ_07520 [Fimbriimonadales bacterium]
MHGPLGFNVRPGIVPSTRNDGTWGANGIYRLTATNNHETLAGVVSILMEARDTDHTYFGAAKIVDPTGFPDAGVPPIAFNPGNQSAVVLGSVGVPPNTNSQYVFVAVANAGAATLPMNLKAVGLEVLQYP